MINRSACLGPALLLLTACPPPQERPSRFLDPFNPPLDPAVLLPISVPCCRCIGAEMRRIHIATGSNDWSVSGPGVPPGAWAQTITSNFDPLWTMALSQGQWVHPLTSNGAGQPGGVYNYTIQIDVPNCTIPMQVFLSGRAAADDRLTGLLDNNPFVTTPTVAISSQPTIAAGAVGWGFRTERIASFNNVPLAPGTHILRFEVPNLASFFGNPTPHGLVVSADLSMVCSDRTTPTEPGEGRGGS